MNKTGAELKNYSMQFPVQLTPQPTSQFNGVISDLSSFNPLSPLPSSENVYTSYPSLLCDKFLNLLCIAYSQVWDKSVKKNYT